MKNKFTNVYLEILNTTLQLLKLNSSPEFPFPCSFPRPESSLSVKTSVKRSSVRKLKLSTAFSLSASANKDSKLFSERSIDR